MFSYSSYESIKNQLVDKGDNFNSSSDEMKIFNLNRFENNCPLLPEYFNTSVNIYDDVIEIVRYKKDVPIIRQFTKKDLEDSGLIPCKLNDFGEYIPTDLYAFVNRDRIFKKVNSQFILNRSDYTIFEALEKSRFNIKVSRQRTLNNLYSYALSNKWDYFFTLTFDQKKYDSSDVDVINDCYSKFAKKLKKLDPDRNCLFILEYHKDKEHIHLHGFVKGNYDEFLTRAYDPKTNEALTDSCGNPIYNCSLWKYGFSTCSKFAVGYNKLRVANYVTKYISKDLIHDSIIPYGTKMLYHTRGLDHRLSLNINLSYLDLCNLLIEFYYDTSNNLRVDDFTTSDITKLSICKKDTDKMTVFVLNYNSA